MAGRMRRLVNAVPAMSWDQVEQRVTSALRRLAPECLDAANPIPIMEILEFRLAKCEDAPLEFSVKDLPPGIEGETDWDRERQRFTIDLCPAVYEALLRGDGRARMTAAHEIGHYILHREIIKQLREARLDTYLEYRAGFHRSNRDVPPYRDSERQAEVFAGRFLLPKSPILRAFQHHDLNSLPELRDHYQVSHHAAQVRLGELGIRV